MILRRLQLQEEQLIMLRRMTSLPSSKESQEVGPLVLLSSRRQIWGKEAQKRPAREFVPSARNLLRVSHPLPCCAERRIISDEKPLITLIDIDDRASSSSAATQDFRLEAFHRKQSLSPPMNEKLSWKCRLPLRFQ
nr:hypothetical protein CFP56_21854 [Quercus suber]